MAARFTVVTGLPVTLIGPDVLTFHEHDVRWREVHRVSVPLPGRNLFLHDLAFTPNHNVVVEYGRLKTGATLLGNRAVRDAIAFDDLHPLRLFVIPRNGVGPTREIYVVGPGQSKAPEEYRTEIEVRID